MDPKKASDKDGSEASSSKGKGKGTGSEDGERGRDTSGLLGSIARSAQAAVTAEALSSVLASGGKAVPGHSSSVNTSSGLQEDLRRAAAGPSVQHQAPGQGHTSTSIRSIQPQGSLQGDAAFAQFSDPTSSAIEQEQQLANRFTDSLHIRHQHAEPQSPAFVGSYDSAQSLDAPMHAQVRATYEQVEPDLSQAWNEATTNITATTAHSPELNDPTYHEAWTRAIPAPMFPSSGSVQSYRQQSFADQHPATEAPDFMSALDAEESAQHPALPAAAAANSFTTPGLTSVWRPPTPSERGALTEEQYQLHRALAEVQDDVNGMRAEERLRPPDDDVDARTGVYAATSEEALRAIWDAPREGERASNIVRDRAEVRSTDGANVIRKIRRLLQRGTFVDDVYGVPPELEATIRQAEQPETEANRDLRASAIARLNALYKQLDVGSN